MFDRAPCMWMRGGSSKGAYFLASDLPDDRAQRDAFLLSVMGSPDPRQIDGIGGADPLCSKVAIVSPSSRAGIDVDYLFLQVAVEQAVVSDGQNCGNILAGVGPFAIERGLVRARGDKTNVSIFMCNSGRAATANINTPNGRVTYHGAAQIDGVPRTAAPVAIEFKQCAGSTCGTLLPTGSACDEIGVIALTMIDNGMPCVVLRAEDMGISGTETRGELNADVELRGRLERLRLHCGRAMNLGDVTHKTIPKMCMVSAPQAGGMIAVRCFIPHQCHAAIGVFAALSVASACLLGSAPVAALAASPDGRDKICRIEHPSGSTTLVIKTSADGSIVSSAIIRTARKLFEGTVFAAPPSCESAEQ